MNKLEKYLKIFLLFTIILNFLYFGYKYGVFYYKNNKNSQEIIKLNKEIKKIQEETKAERKITKEEKEKISKKHSYQKYNFGLSTKFLKIDTKIIDKKKKKVYYLGKLYYNVNNVRNRNLALKKLIVLKYLDPNVYKITKVTRYYIELILERNYDK